MNIDEQERTEFEAWYRLHHGSRDVYGRDASGEYVDKQVQSAFNVWLARAALTAQDEALLRQALEALEEASDALHKGHPVRMHTQKAIAALRERLGLRYEPTPNEGSEP